MNGPKRHQKVHTNLHRQEERVTEDHVISKPTAERTKTGDKTKGGGKTNHIGQPLWAKKANTPWTVQSQKNPRVEGADIEVPTKTIKSQGTLGRASKGEKSEGTFGGCRDLTENKKTKKPRGKTGFKKKYTNLPNEDTSHCEKERPKRARRVSQHPYSDLERALTTYCLGGG